MADFLDEAVGAKPFEEARHLAAVQFGQMAAQGFVLYAADVKFAAKDGAKQQFVVGIEQIEAGIASAFLFNGL